MSETEHALPAELAEALIVRPGNTLILRLASDISPEQCQRFRANIEPGLKEQMPGVKIVWLGGIEQMLLYRPDDLAEGG